MGGGLDRRTTTHHHADTPAHDESAGKVHGDILGSGHQGGTEDADDTGELDVAQATVYFSKVGDEETTQTSTCKEQTIHGPCTIC